MSPSNPFFLFFAQLLPQLDWGISYRRSIEWRARHLQRHHRAQFVLLGKVQTRCDTPKKSHLEIRRLYFVSVEVLTGSTRPYIPHIHIYGSVRLFCSIQASPTPSTRQRSNGRDRGVPFCRCTGVPARVLTSRCLRVLIRRIVDGDVPEACGSKNGKISKRRVIEVTV